MLTVMTRALQVRGVPDEVHRELRARAAAAGMSLSDYLLEELTRVASRPRIADVLARAGARHGGVASQAIVGAVRAEREAAGGRS